MKNAVTLNKHPGSHFFVSSGVAPVTIPLKHDESFALRLLPPLFPKGTGACPFGNNSGHFNIRWSPGFPLFFVSPVVDIRVFYRGG